MNHDAVRKLIAEGIIGLAVIAGVFFIAVEPLTRAAREAQTGNQAAHLARAAFDPLKAKYDAADLVQRVKRIADASTFAEDELEALNRLTQAAEHAGLAVENIEQRAIARSPVSAPVTPATPQPNQRAFGFALTALGPYDKTAAFIRSVQNDMGFASVVSARLTPAGDTRTPLVRLSLNTLHTWVDADAASAAADAASRALHTPEAAQ
jgi:hypothetical protein